MKRFNNKLNYLDLNSIPIKTAIEEREMSRFFIKYIDWKLICKKEKLTDEFMTKHIDKLDWFLISKHQKLSEDFIRRFYLKLYWDEISEYQKLSCLFMKEFHKKISWAIASKHQVLSESLIEEFKDSVSWYSICRCQTLSAEFIIKNSCYIEPDYIDEVLGFQKLSISLIENFAIKDYHWNWISRNKSLTDNIAGKYIKKLNVRYLIDNPGLSDSFKEILKTFQ